MMISHDPNRGNGNYRPTATLSRRARKGRLNIIGISAGYHDSACSLIQDGVLVAAAQEERFSRVKNDKSLPVKAFLYCLQEGGITIADVDCVGYYEDPYLKLGRQVWMGFMPNLPPARRDAILDRLSRPQPPQMIMDIMGYQGRLEVFDHHLSHAASTYFFSGFDEAAILTVDAVGEWATTTYGRADGATIELFEEVRFPHSLGLWYSALTAYIGFDVNDAEYKVMGLAPYGKPRYVEALRSLIAVSEDGQFRLDLRYFGFTGSEGRMFSDELCALLGSPPRKPE